MIAIGYGARFVMLTLSCMFLCPKRTWATLFKDDLPFSNMGIKQLATTFQSFPMISTNSSTNDFIIFSPCLTAQAPAHPDSAQRGDVAHGAPLVATLWPRGMCPVRGFGGWVEMWWGIQWMVYAVRYLYDISISFYIYIYISIYLYIYIYGWWFGTFFLFSHILGIIIPTDFHISQRGWNL